MSLYITGANGWVPVGGIVPGSIELEKADAADAPGLDGWTVPASFSASIRFESLSREFLDFLFYPMLAPRAQRRVRKRRRLAGHYAAKAARVPAWKRVDR